MQLKCSFTVKTCSYENVKVFFNLLNFIWLIIPATGGGVLHCVSVIQCCGPSVYFLGSLSDVLSVFSWSHLSYTVLYCMLGKITIFLVL
uniref:Uncharacterized protein n=1 Tax=Anguilla anguilla TaxID=7936 RepID=A0A0E9XN10_ANGAN